MILDYYNLDMSRNCRDATGLCRPNFGQWSGLCAFAVGADAVIGWPLPPSGDELKHSSGPAMVSALDSGLDFARCRY